MIRKTLTALALTAGAVMVPSAAHADVNVGDINVANNLTVIVHDVLNGLTALVNIL